MFKKVFCERVKEMFNNKFTFLLISLFFLSVISVVGDDNSVIGTRGCPFGPTNHCELLAYCPSQDFYANGVLIAEGTVCTRKFLNYQRCNSNEHISRRDQQCLGILQNPSRQFDPVSNPVIVSSRCLPAESDQRGNNPQLTHGEFYCLPVYQSIPSFPSINGPECYNQEQCQNGICDRKPDYEDKKICQQGMIGSGTLYGGTSPSTTSPGACFFDNQCSQHTSNIDACAGEDRSSSPYVPGICRQQPGPPQIGFTVRSDLYGNIRGTSAASDAIGIGIDSGDIIELNWNVIADTVNSGPLSCTGTSDPPGLWSYSLQNWQESTNLAPYPLLWRSQTPRSQKVGPLTQNVVFTFSCINGRTQTPISKTVQVTLRSTPLDSCVVNEASCLLVHLDFERSSIGGGSRGRQLFLGGPENSCFFPQMCTRNLLGEFSPGIIGGNPVLSPPLGQPGPRYFEFDGTEDVIKIPLLATDPTLAQGFTISFWVKPTALSTGNLFNFRSSISNSEYMRLYQHNSATNDPFGDLSGRFGNSGFFVEEVFERTPSSWKHIAISVEPQPQGALYRLYESGDLIGESLDRGTATGRDVADILLFGSDFLGGLDEIKIFKSALPHHRIANLYTLREGVIGANSQNRCLIGQSNSVLCPAQLPSGNRNNIISTLIANAADCTAVVTDCQAYCAPGYTFQSGSTPEQARCVPSTGPACTPTNSPETVCNGVDDDCDTRVDEDFVGTTTSCGVGICQAMGVTTCPQTIGQNTLGNTCIPGTPQSEICTDTLDNDCDGTVNNGCPVSLFGDQNNDHRLTASDVVSLSRIIAAGTCSNITTDLCRNADINCDSVITLNDVIMLIRHVLNGTRPVACS